MPVVFVIISIVNAAFYISKKMSKRLKFNKLLFAIDTKNEAAKRTFKN
jgi:hypothetical protein